MAKHHTEIRQFRIFALVLGEDFFVGKTASPRISAVYSRHRCGAVAATRGTMDQEEIPSLYILEDLKCTGSEAYKHILAWICRFEEAGYCTINHTGTAIASESLYPYAQEILDKLLLEPMDEILKRSYVAKPSEANRKPARKLIPPDRQEKHVQMNLRMSQKDKKVFDRFCKINHLKAREALGLLLDQITGEDHHRQQLLSAHKALLEENDRLKERFALQQGTLLSRKDLRIVEYLSFLQSGLTVYLRQFLPDTEAEPLPSLSYKRFQKHLPVGVHYEYPENEGFLQMTAEAMLWGGNHSRFVVGQGLDGENLKVRYYSRPLYAGVRIWEYPAGIRWLVGCRRATDGAMEIAAAFPVPDWIPCLEEVEPYLERQEKASLDEQIYNALQSR